MEAPDRIEAVTRVRLGEGGTAGGTTPGFHRLAADGDAGFRRVAVRPEPDEEDGVLRFTGGPLRALTGEGAWILVPLPLPDRRPGDGALDFVAEIGPPPGFRLADLFPSRVETLEGGGVRIALPAPPALLRFRLIPEDSAALTLPALVDAATVLLLVALAGFGAVRLLSSRAEDA